MAIATFFERAIEDMEEETLGALLASLINTTKKRSIGEAADKAKFVAMVRYLLSVADFLDRKKAAEAALNTEGLPHDIYLFFACDNIQIAESFLEPASELSEESLLHIAKYCSREHRIGLLARDDLTPDIRWEIMRHNEVDVIRMMNSMDDKAVFFEYDDVISVDEKDLYLEGYGLEIDEELEVENPLDLMLQGYVENSRFADIIELLAQHGDLSKEMVKGMFSKKEVEPISIFCRGLGIGTEAFGALARFRCRRLGQMDRLADNAVEAYEQISLEYAEAMLSDLKQQAPHMARRLSS